MIARVFRAAQRAAAAAAIAAIGFYQRGISPLIGARCRYYPSCSAYAAEAIAKYGVVVGVLKGIWRIARCNPFSRGGYDPP